MKQMVGNSRIIEMVLDSSNALEMSQRLTTLLGISDVDTIELVKWTIEAAENKAVRRAIGRMEATAENINYEVYCSLGNR